MPGREQYQLIQEITEDESDSNKLDAFSVSDSEARKVN